MLSSRILVTMGMVAFTPFQVDAESASVTFEAEVSDTCMITVGDPGLLVVGENFTKLRTWLPGGSGAFADISANSGSFSVSVQKPTSFLNAPPSAMNAEFYATYSLFDATEATNIGWETSTALNPGSTTIRVHTSAWLPNNAVFEPGEYRTTATVTCQ